MLKTPNLKTNPELSPNTQADSLCLLDISTEMPAATQHLLLPSFSQSDQTPRSCRSLSLWAQSAPQPLTPVSSGSLGPIIPCALLLHYCPSPGPDSQNSCLAGLPAFSLPFSRHSPCGMGAMFLKHKSECVPSCSKNMSVFAAVLRIKFSLP